MLIIFLHMLLHAGFVTLVGHPQQSKALSAKTVANSLLNWYNPTYMGKIQSIEKNSKKDREREVLLGLVDLYLKQAKPIGSNTLKECGFDHLSSATIRNYFARLEIEGFLKQHHSSGGRIPTDKAYKLFAEEKLRLPLKMNKDDEIFLQSLLGRETKEVSPYLQEATEALSELTACAAFITAPRFDQDFIVKIHLLKIDEKRALCVIVTDFSLIHTEVLFLPKKMTEHSLKRIEEYFFFRLTGLEQPDLDPEEYNFAQTSYNEIVLRHFVSYTNMQSEDVYRGGLSKLLKHPEFHDPIVLSNTLSLFENTDTVREITSACFSGESVKYWIGEDLKQHIPSPVSCALLAIPYYLNNKAVGTLVVLGPDRIDYEKVFGLLHMFSKMISESLTKSMYKFKLTYRQPDTKAIPHKHKKQLLIELHDNL